MPEHINGVKLTAKEHRQWKAVNDSAGPAAATAAVKKSIAKRKQKRSGK